jgi:precorrin-2/cobalt-factor-2 C20-methyltransferase
MNKGIFYGIGLGPGDPELITVKGLNALKKSDIVFTVKSQQSNRSISGAIIDYHNISGLEKNELLFAMTKNREERNNMIKQNAKIILTELEKGKNCAFATIGDPMTYSTYGYIKKEIQKLNPDITVITIPGVNSWSALAAANDTILVEDKECLCIVPSYDEENIVNPKHKKHTTVYLKTYKTGKSIVKKLSDSNRTSLYGSNIGLENEFITTEPDQVLKRNNEYLSLIISRSKNKK